MVFRRYFGVRFIRIHVYFSLHAHETHDDRRFIRPAQRVFVTLVVLVARRQAVDGIHLRGTARFIRLIAFEH